MIPYHFSPGDNCITERGKVEGLLSKLISGVDNRDEWIRMTGLFYGITIGRC